MTDSPPALHAAALSFVASRRLGVHLAGDGVDVAVYSANATSMTFCLLDTDADGGLVERRVELLGPDFGVWHGHIAGVSAGQRYGLRADGRWEPGAGSRFNPHKLLLDPYARALAGSLSYRGEIYAHQADDAGAPLGDAPLLDTRDSAPFVPHAVVESEEFDWGDSAQPQVPWDLTVVYEAHVRGLTMLLPGVPEHLRGTYAGLAHPTTLAHLTSLGVTTIELLPIHASLTEPALVARGVENYWGYNTAAFFAPEPRYATQEARDAGPQAVVNEVKGMVKLLHEAGLEVVLDVVYNHTCEGGPGGPTLSWRGLDDSTYYVHDGADPGAYVDVTGCGNSLDFSHTPVIEMTLDSLRYWVEQYHIDGFRYDLAVTLGRDYQGFDPGHPFLTALRTDPVLRRVKHIAEPWDLGMGGWQTGNFPPPMAAWNDRFRGGVRGFWLQGAAAASHGRDGVGVRDLATRLSGSSDTFSTQDPMWRRGPISAVNFVTAHDGFTMADLVTFDRKHNEANGESGRDGTDDNRSWNHGFEGPVGADTEMAPIIPTRQRSIRNLMGTLLLSAGIPMITAGDEMGRSQQGNNNAYCQDNEISWLDWERGDWKGDLLATTTYLLRLRRENPVLRPVHFFTGNPISAGGMDDLAWFDASGNEMDYGHWQDPNQRTLQMLRAAPTSSLRDLLLILNGGLEQAEVTLPNARDDLYELMWDSDWDSPAERQEVIAEAQVFLTAGETTVLEPLSMRVYLTVVEPE